MNLASFAGSKFKVKKDATRIREEALLAAAKMGQEWAFVELCTAPSVQVFHTVRRIMKCREDTEDVCQEAVMRVYIHLKDFKHDCSFQTWFTRIAINSAFMVLRKRHLQKEISVDAPFADNATWGQMELVDRSRSPEERYAQCEDATRLQSAILQLPVACRDVLKVRYATDASLKEIAQLAGISVGATKSRLLRARRILRNKLA